MAADDDPRRRPGARPRPSFAKRDANRDGFLTAEEMGRRGGGKMRAAPGSRAARARDPNAAFDRLDANRDGVDQPRRIRQRAARCAIEKRAGDEAAAHARQRVAAAG